MAKYFIRGYKMKKGSIKTIKETSVLLELGIDFQANDLEDDVYDLKRVNDKKVDEIVRANFDGIGCPRVIWTGFFDKKTKSYRITVAEDLFV